MAAPTTLSRPIRTPFITKACAPIHTLSSIVIGARVAGTGGSCRCSGGRLWKSLSSSSQSESRHRSPIVTDVQVPIQVAFSRQSAPTRTSPGPAKRTSLLIRVRSPMLTRTPRRNRIRPRISTPRPSVNRG